MDIAEKYFLTVTPRDQNNELYPISINENTFVNYGIGIVYYFKFMKYMGFLFGIMFLFAIPIIVYSA